MQFSEPTEPFPSEPESKDLTVEWVMGHISDIRVTHGQVVNASIEPGKDGWYHFTVSRGPARKALWQRLLSLLPWRR